MYGGGARVCIAMAIGSVVRIGHAQRWIAIFGNAHWTKPGRDQDQYRPDCDVDEMAENLFVMKSGLEIAAHWKKQKAIPIGV